MMLWTAVFYILVLLWSLYATYWLVFKILPAFDKGASHHGGHAPSLPVEKKGHARPQHSTHDGFSAFAKDGELTVDDIVKALSRD